MTYCQVSINDNWIIYHTLPRGFGLTNQIFQEKVIRIY